MSTLDASSCKSELQHSSEGSTKTQKLKNGSKVKKSGVKLPKAQNGGVDQNSSNTKQGIISKLGKKFKSSKINLTPSEVLNRDEPVISRNRRRRLAKLARAKLLSAKKDSEVKTSVGKISQPLNGAINQHKVNHESSKIPRRMNQRINKQSKNLESALSDSSIFHKKGMNKSKQTESASGVLDSRSKMEKLFEVEKKRKKVKKIKETQSNNATLRDNISSSTSKKKQKMQKKFEDLSEANLNNCEVVLNKKIKKKMLKTAKSLSEGKLEKMQHAQGTANPSFDTSITDSVSDIEHHKNSKKVFTKEKASTDAVDGNLVSTFKKYKLGTKSKKGLIPDSSLSGMIPDRVAKKKLSVTKLLEKASILDSKSFGQEMRGQKASNVDSLLSYDVKKMRKLQREGAFKEDKDPSSSSPKNKKQKKAPTSLREKMLEQLKSARFRWLNEQLYCSNSWDALKYFKEDPDAYEAYHSGYRNQVAQWPVNPVDIIIKAISSLPRDSVVADFGCGDAHLAASLPDRKVHSLDLIASKPGVIACDMAHSPLLMESVDIAVFCLSLMGTNLNDFILEANRVLKVGGLLYIAEVESRFEDIDNFTSAMVHFGFTLKKKDVSHQMFIFMDFKKARTVKKAGKLPELTLEPCLYKKR